MHRTCFQLCLLICLHGGPIPGPSPPPPTYLVSTDRGEPTRKAPPLFREGLTREDMQGRKADKPLGNFFSIERSKSLTNRPIESSVSHLRRSSEKGLYRGRPLIGSSVIPSFLLLPPRPASPNYWGLGRLSS